MEENKLKLRLPSLFTILLYLLLITAVILLMRHVQQLLNADAQVNLTEVVTQNKNVITTKLKVEVNNLELSAKQMAERVSHTAGVTDELLKDAYRDLQGENHDAKLFVSNVDGETLMEDGGSINIAGRTYFRYAMEGVPNISDRIVSRQDGNEVFIISVPILVSGTVVGTMQRSYSPEEMYQICAVSLFSAQGYMYIINSEGYILMSSRQEENQTESNYFRLLYAEGNQDAFRQLQEDIHSNRAGFMEARLGGEVVFSAYTPIEEVHDWYLISSVSTKAVAANATAVIHMFYLILIVVVTVFGVSILYFLHIKRKQQASLAQIAFVDNVTQGSTYNKFAVDLKKALSSYPDQAYFLLTFDIDNFKYVNSFYGFDCGDRILCQLEQSVHGHLVQGESIARISSDHFVVLLKSAEEDRINRLLEPVTSTDGVTVYLSGGLYALQNREESINLMVDKASAAAQVAKGVLHRRVEFYSEQFEKNMIHNEQMKRAVQDAISNQEMIAYYQPKVDVNTGALVGAEALARWKSSDGRLIPPFEFIPLCENTGLVVELDMAIFERVLQFLQMALTEGMHCVPISVNFSRLHLANPDFIDNVVAKLTQYNVPARLIEIELTESVIFDNHDIISEFIFRLHEKGLLVSMDDFGSGYSSLNMLKDVPIDVLKVDKEFLKETADNTRRDIIFSTIAQMAKRLEITVVVEGVETLENVNLMKAFGCQVAQGYYFARPMDVSDFKPLYRSGKV